MCKYVLNNQTFHHCFLAFVFNILSARQSCCNLVAIQVNFEFTICKMIAGSVIQGFAVKI